MKLVNVLVGRFQVAELTETQHTILNYIISKANRKCNPVLAKSVLNIIVLGVPVTKATKNNPLDFDSRRRMIEEAYPNTFKFYYLKDEHNDFEWSRKLDAIIGENCSINYDNVTIYGSKDTFINHYFGKCNTEDLNIDNIHNVENDGKSYCGRKVENSADWRAGAVWSASNRYPTVYPTVDCVIFDDLDYTKVWMAKKENENGLRFVGGFVDPKDDSFEVAALREAYEETGLTCTNVSYICTQKIDDWRYRNEDDKIITTLYAMYKCTGIPKPNDDIKELYRVDIMSLDPENVQPEHRKLLEKVKSWIETKKLFQVCFHKEYNELKRKHENDAN